jgi:hypothetical protein
MNVNVSGRRRFLEAGLAHFYKRRQLQFMRPVYKLW